MNTSRHNNPEILKALEKAVGVQPGELYEAEEQCHTDITQHTWKGRAFEVYYDQMAGPLTQWKAWCMGIGGRSNEDRDAVIAAMRQAIENDAGNKRKATA